jgi:hypothetical protein
MIFFSPSKQISVYEFIQATDHIHVTKGKKVKFTTEQDIKAQRGRVGTTPLFL